RSDPGRRRLFPPHRFAGGLEIRTGVTVLRNGSGNLATVTFRERPLESRVKFGAFPGQAATIQSFQCIPNSLLDGTAPVRKTILVNQSIQARQQFFINGNANLQRSHIRASSIDSPPAPSA